MTNVENPNNLYAQMSTPERFHLVVPMMIKDKEGKELHLPMVVLNGREQREVKVSAYNEVVALLKHTPKKDEFDDVFIDLLESSQCCWTIFYATRLPGDVDKRFFMSKQQVEDQYSNEELAIVSTNYLNVTLAQPHIKMLTSDDSEDKFENLIKEIIAAGKQPDFFLNGYTTHSLKMLIHYLVNQRETSQKDNGSSGEL